MTSQTITREPTLKFQKTDGGRKAAGYKGRVGDCVVRSLAIIIAKRDDLEPGQAYQKIYDRVYQLNKECFDRKRKKTRQAAPKPYDYTYKKVTKQVMEEFGGRWTATMQIGSGCQVHLRADELPAGLLAVSVSKHITVVDNFCIKDTHNPSRGGDRCVYGYWEF